MPKYIFLLNLFCRFRLTALSFVFLWLLGAPQAWAQVAVKFPADDTRIYDIQEVDGKVWLGSKNGAYRVEGNNATHLPNENIFIRQIKVIDGKVWLASNKGAWRIDGDTARRFPNNDIFIEQIEEVGGQVWLRTDKGAWRIDGNTARRLPDENINLLDIKEVGGKVWIRSDIGAYRIDGNDAKRFPEEKIYIRQIEEAGGSVWLATDKGAFRVEGNSAKRMPDKNIFIQQIQKDGDKVWLGSDTGAYRIDSKATQRLPNLNVLIEQIYLIGGKIWLKTDKGAYRIDGNNVKRFPKEKIYIQEIHDIGGKAWLRSDKGVWKVDGDTTVRLPKESVYIKEIKEVSGKVWLLSDNGAWRVDGNEARRLPNDKIQTREIVVAGGKFWLATNKGAYRVDGNSAKKFPDTAVKIKTITEVAGKVWIGSDNGAWRVDGDTARLMTPKDIKVNQIEEVAGKVWLATNKGAWRVEGDVARRFPDSALDVRQIHSIGGKVWLATVKGAWRVDENISVRVAQSFPQTWWGNALAKILPENILTSPFKVNVAYYDSTLQKLNPYGDAVQGDFRIVIASDEISLKSKIASGNFEPAKNFSQSFPTGKQTLHYQARDQWNNSFQGSMNVWVLPNLTNYPVIGAGAWFLLVIIVFALAPVSKVCNALMMNKWFRRLGSLFIIPLLITLFPVARRHLLKKYLRRLRNDEEYSRWKTEFVFPSHEFLPDVFGNTIREWQKVFILGKSGVGKTSYCKFLACHFANWRGSKKLLGKTIPVFLPMASFIQDSLETMIQDQLSDYARLTDRNMVSWLLSKGRFLILIDGLNEIREDRVHLIKEFVNQFGQNNFICLSSLEKHKEFKDVKDQTLCELKSDMIKDFIRLKVERDCGGDEFKLEQELNKILSHFADNTHRVYANPQELEFAIELAGRGRDVPGSRERLYEEMIKSWLGDDGSPLSETLFQQSYEMLSEYRPYFDQIENPLPREIRERLLKKGLLIERRSQYFFRHELIRAGFAANYFLPRWRKLIANEKLKIQKDWRPMLELTILRLQNSHEASGEIKVLLFQILKKNRDLAKELFLWLKGINPVLCSVWENEFTAKLGAELLAG